MIEIEEINGEKICLAGLGRMFYESGFPISIGISHLGKKGIKSSILHIADECLKHGWSPETTFKRLSEDINDQPDVNFDLDVLKEFCYASYEDQRDMIFKYLFTDTENAKQWLHQKLK